MSDLDPLRNLAQTLAYDPGQPVTMTKGVVIAYSIGGQPPTLTIQLSGDTTTNIAGVRFLDSYSPAVGDVVQVIKQGPMLMVLGQIAGGATHANNGWVTPVLASGFAEHAFDPPYYRLVLDNGSKKVQLRGRVNITGSPTLLWTMPADLRPAFNMGPVLVPRGFSGGSVAAQLDIQSNGNLSLLGGTVGVTGVSSSGGGTTGGVIRVFAPPGCHPNSSSPASGGPFCGDTGTGHQHDIAHTHSTPNHTHTMTSVTYPDFVSLNGVEYFI